MLLTVEGGGFFSSSALGYKKGFVLLLLGWRKEETPMRVSPWNRCQPMDKEVSTDLQLVSRKSRDFRGCLSFIRFSCLSAAKNGPSPPKVGPLHHPETSPDSSANNIICEDSIFIDVVDEGEGKPCQTSSLKKSSKDFPVSAIQPVEAEDSLRDIPLSKLSGSTERKKVQWTDLCGKELVEIREFELSDEEALDDEDDLGDKSRCQCIIQ